MSTSRNAWLLAIKIQQNQITASSHEQLINKHNYAEQELEGRRADGSTKKSKFIKIGSKSALGDQAELFILQNETYVKFCTQVQWAPETVFETYGDDILVGTLKTIWDTTRVNGHFWYDPNHPDAETMDGFIRLLGSVFIQWSKHDSPGDSLATRIMSLEWKNHHYRGTFYDPQDFKRRLSALWLLCDMLPHTGPATTDNAKLKAVWNGLTDDAQLYIKDEQREDPFDAANGGANEMDWTDVFDLLQPYWNREFKKISDNYQEKKRKREDDDENDDDANDDGRKNRRRKNKYRNGDKRNGNQRNGGSKGGDKGDDRGTGKNPFYSQCKFHDNHKHQYKDCIFCPTGSKFDADKAKKFYDSGRAPDWYKKTYEKKVLNSNGPPQQQQYFVQPQLQQQQGVYMAMPTAASASQSQQQLQLPPPPSQIAPTFTTSTANPAPAQGGQRLYTMQTDANGNNYFVQAQL